MPTYLIQAHHSYLGKDNPINTYPPGFNVGLIDLKWVQLDQCGAFDANSGISSFKNMNATLE